MARKRRNWASKRKGRKVELTLRPSRLHQSNRIETMAPPPSSPPAPSAQTIFFSTSFPSLHELVLDHLSGSDSRHLVLPLLAVNRHWRGVARDHLLRTFKNAKLSMVEESEGSEHSDEEGSPQMVPVFEGDYIKASSTSTSLRWSPPPSLFIALIRFPLLLRSSSRTTVLTTVPSKSPILESTSPTILPLSTTRRTRRTQGSQTFRRSA